MDVLVLLVCLGLLCLWTLGRFGESDQRQREREDLCAHEPEWQETIRISDIISRNPTAATTIIRGRRSLVKRCRGCGRQTTPYREER
jgi:hypothetical protein